MGTVKLKGLLMFIFEHGKMKKTNVGNASLTLILPSRHHNINIYSKIL